MQHYHSAIRTIRPLADGVLVRLIPAAETEAQGLIVAPQNLTRRATQGAWAEVITCGDKSYRKVCSKCERPYDEYADEPLRPGDRVLLDSDKSGDALLLDGQECRMVRMAEIHAVVAT